MKKLLLSLTLLLSLNSKAQTNSMDTTLIRAGNELQQYNSIRMMGHGSTLIGIGIGAIAISEGEQYAPLLITAGSFALFGIILSEIVAPQKIQNAGIILSNKGLGIELPRRLSKKKLVTYVEE